MSEKSKITSAKQSAQVVSSSLIWLRELVGDVGLEKGHRVFLMIRKFWFRMVLYAVTENYDIPICFLGIGEDSINKPFKNSFTVDLSEGTNVDFSMNIEDDMDKFFQLLEERKTEIIVMEGVSNYLKPETVRAILEFVKKNEMKIIFTSTSRVLNEYLVSIGRVNEGVLKSCFEDYMDCLDETFKTSSNTKMMLDFLGLKIIKMKYLEANCTKKKK